MAEQRETQTTTSFVAPRLTTTERAALTPVTGMIIFNTNSTPAQFEMYDGAWKNTSVAPSLTTTQRAALTPAVGMILFNTTTGFLEVYDGAWKKVTVTAV